MGQQNSYLTVINYGAFDHASRVPQSLSDNYCIHVCTCTMYTINSCKTQRGLHGNAWLQLFCHPKYSILYGALILFTVGSGQE